MRLLVDSHAVVWAVDDPSRLSPQAVLALEDPANELLLSAATIWEIAIKVGLKKLTLSMPYRQWMNTAIADMGLTLLLRVVQPFHGDSRGERFADRAGRKPIVHAPRRWTCRAVLAATMNPDQ